MQVFGSLKLLMTFLGPSWPLLGLIWSQNGLQNGPNSNPKSVQKLIQKMTPKNTERIPIWGPKISRKWGEISRGTLTQATPATLLAQDGPKMLPRCPKMAQDGPPRWLKIAQDGPKMAPLAKGKAETVINVSFAPYPHAS